MSADANSDVVPADLIDVGSALAGQLVTAAKAARPQHPTVTTIMVRGRRARHYRQGAVVGVVVVLLVLASGASVRFSSGDGTVKVITQPNMPTAGPDPAPPGSVPATTPGTPAHGTDTTGPTPPAEVTATVTLSSTTIVAGSSIPATVTITNRTGHDLKEGGCVRLFNVDLSNETIKPTVEWPDCLTVFTIPTGTSTYPVTVATTYHGCGNGPPQGDVPTCLPGGTMPPLPPGTYQATLYQHPIIAATPPPITVTLTQA